MTDGALERFTALFGPEFGHGKTLETERLRRALALLGAPQHRLPPTIHVAGANGKGSTIAFLRAMAEQAGLCVHAFTKPHLLRLNERFVVASQIIDEARLIAAAERVAAADEHLTQFEAQTAAAFLLFAETPADLCLIETGMGGRDDATNVLTRPALCVITPIALDHQDALGAGLADIARHKAGILKAGVPAIIARQDEAASAVIAQTAAQIGAPLCRQGVEWDCFASHGRLVVQTETRALDLSPPALFGAHQIDNAGLAVAALLSLDDARIDEAAMSRGLASAHWPGRMQPLTSGPLAAPVLAAGGELWIDGAHNAHAAAALSRTLAALDRRTPRPLALIIGMRARKDAQAFIHALAPHAQLVIAIPLGDDGAAPDHLARLAGGVSEASLEHAIARALQLSAPRIVITGSLKLAGEALSRA
jgi:dihydrofolate synthase / folylpolyglutamate synthase